MKFKDNVKVIAGDGQEVGRVRRVVLDPLTDEVKDLVVRAGVLLTEDRVVPLSYVDSTNDEAVKLSIKSDDFEKLLFFEDAHYVAVDGQAADFSAAAYAPAYYAYPPFGTLSPAGFGATISPELLGYQLKRERHIPAHTVALKEGAVVKGRDDHEVGRLEQVLTARDSDRATHLVVADGHLRKTRRVIPLEWVAGIEETEVRLAVPVRTVENLPEYKG